ncbi:MAG: MBL fold metallo-hydrolase [Mangrovibacterium sp.]
MIQIKKFVFNPLRENTYVLYDETGECVLVDAGCYDEPEEQELTGFIEENGLHPVKLVNTHCHFDHILGVGYCRARYRIPFLIHPDDEFLIEGAAAQGYLFGVSTGPLDPPDGYIREGEQLRFGNSVLEVLHVPGHAPGSLAFYQPRQQFVLSGDALFCGSIGRADLPRGDYDQLVAQIRAKLLVLPEETVVYCGHGPETTIGAEKACNPFFV